MLVGRVDHGDCSEIVSHTCMTVGHCVGFV